MFCSSSSLLAHRHCPSLLEWLHAVHHNSHWLCTIVGSIKVNHIRLHTHKGHQFTTPNQFSGLSWWWGAVSLCLHWCGFCVPLFDIEEESQYDIHDIITTKTSWWQHTAILSFWNCQMSKHLECWEENYNEIQVEIVSCCFFLEKHN